ncbi:MaoC/PaaZ C-terminal domain-containing protein [Metasolibacillus meyeri]|uniref:MaoC/PaaZ C-terminal domain-containing protein n=1 Tax=Metasolibacillus meyeri TaxID=1071052 RepID=A0AAW9NS10_9BACL|nr:MaoC/PaaZ C-terminal domain-containing protein [Metasolibacillus meyeri]MEC1180407.1 MaoC/PaaZ C-terminal domain-containing protein [Metasolibacillus meyeri]
MLQKNRKQGRLISTLTVGEKLHITEKMDDKDLLIYLGLTNDNNPLFIQHDYAASTSFEQPIVPQIMLTGIINSAISKHMPGPGSYILEQALKFLAPVYHYETVDFVLEIEHIDEAKNEVIINVTASNMEKEQLLEGTLKVSPPRI